MLQKFSEQHTALQISKQIKSRSIVDLRVGNSYSLATARKESSLDVVESLIAQFVLNLSHELNLTHKLSDASIMAISEDVYEVGYFMNIEELAYFFKQLRKGKFGSMYENLNSEKVCTALSKFINERSKYFEEKNIGTHNENRERPGKRVNETTEFRENMKQSLNKLAVEKELKEKEE